MERLNISTFNILGIIVIQLDGGVHTIIIKTQTILFLRVYHGQENRSQSFKTHLNMNVYFFHTREWIRKQQSQIFSIINKVFEINSIHLLIVAQQQLIFNCYIIIIYLYSKVNFPLPNRQQLWVINIILCRSNTAAVYAQCPCLVNVISSNIYI